MIGVGGNHWLADGAADLGVGVERDIVARDCVAELAVFDGFGSVDIGDAVGQLKSVDPQGELVSAARAIGICFGD